ncbi:1-aminocyclopropane-1-carboxylate synthase-like protein 1 [Physella acuta]|uniref:1-aminocyclopropane-1-carboxylate synthase-like protein 1 n=1 Tax=Physella acuta TaxID=109671 RepID=UPI0027DD21E8|nr:1-aminocyclopropane-1-carboxylate synthase-like protein 1 [Physella acuta]
MAESLSSRGQDMLTQGTYIQPFFARVRQNRYHPVDNPRGIADLGLAENKLCEDMWEQKLGPAVLAPEDGSLLYYEKATGNIGFKETMKKFIEKRFKARHPLSTDNIFITNGVTVVLEALAFALADPGDFIMVMSPYYYRIKNDLYERPTVNVLEVFISLELLHQGQGDISVVFESVYRKAISEGKQVKAVLLVNPSNPSGLVMTSDHLMQVLDFANRYKLHVIANEIYAQSVSDPDVRFTSVLSLPLPDPGRVHFTWGVSKDLGLSGYRCGVVYTCNPGLTQYLGLTSIYFRCAGLIQHRLNQVLGDDDWLDNVLFPTMRRRMRERFTKTRDMLTSYGVEVFPTPATIFMWANFSQFLSDNSFEAERDLFGKFLDGGVFFLPGQSCYSPEPGWFRLVLSLDAQVHEEGFVRLKQVLKEIKPSIQA